MKKKLLFTMAFIACAFGIKAQTVFSGKAIAAKGAPWTNSDVTYPINDIASALDLDGAALKTALDEKTVSITAINTEGVAVGGTNVGEGTQFTSYYTRNGEEGYKYGCFFMNAEGKVVGGSQYWKWVESEWEWKQVYGTFAHHFDYDSDHIIIHLMQGNDGEAGIFTAKITLAVNDKTVELQSTLVVNAHSEAEMSEIIEGTVYVQQTPNQAGDWSSVWFGFDASAFLTATHTTYTEISDNLATLLYTSDGTTLVNTHNTTDRGFWFKQQEAENPACIYATADMEFYFDHPYYNEYGLMGGWLGQGYGNLAAGDRRIATLFLIYGDKAVKLNVVFDIVNVMISENTTYSPVAAEGQAVSLSRTIINTGLNTLVLPFSLTQAEVESAFGEGAKIYEVGTYENGHISFVEASGITANRPCLLETTEASTGAPYIFTGRNIENGEAICNGTNVKMAGSYANETSIEKDANNYIFYGDALYLVNSDNVKMKGTRAYIQLTDGTEAKSRLSYSLDAANATGMASLQIETPSTESGIFYNLNGQRVVKPLRGIYIKDGKKVLVK